jgi:thiamine monophosphate kinase
LQLQSSGDDYALCFTADPACQSALLELAGALSLTLTRIGTCVAGQGVEVLRHGVPIAPGHRGHSHF